MNTKRILARGQAFIIPLFAILITFTLEIPLLAAASNSASADFWARLAFVGSAHVKDIKGHAEYLTAEGAWAPLGAGNALSIGTKIRTLQNSKIILQMDRSGSLVRIKPYTVVRLSPLEKDMDLSSLTGKEGVDGFAVRALRGQAQFRIRNGSWNPVRVNTVLAEGTEVKTSSEATLTVFYASTGLVVRVMPNSTVRLAAAPVTLAGQIMSNRGGEAFSGIQTAGMAEPR